MYGTPYPEGMAAYFPALSADQTPFYTSAVSILSVLEHFLRSLSKLYKLHTLVYRAFVVYLSNL